MSVSLKNIQAENANSLSKYPLSAVSTGIDDSGIEIPQNLIEEIHITSFTHLSNVRLASMYIGKRIASVVLCDDSGVVAHATVFDPKDFEEVDFDSDREGVYAKIRLGCISSSGTGQYRFSTSEQSGLDEFCTVEFEDTGVSKFVDDVSGETASGDVELVFGQGFETSVDLDEGASTITVGLTTGGLKRLADKCNPVDPGTACSVPVIQTINGVAPDDIGNIAIVLE